MAQSSNGLTKRPKVSVFREVGLFDDEDDLPPLPPPQSIKSLPKRPSMVRFRSDASIIPCQELDSEWEDTDSEDEQEGYIDGFQKSLDHPSWMSSKICRLGILAYLLALSIPVFQSNSLFGGPGKTLLGAKGGVIREHSRPNSFKAAEVDVLRARDDSPTDVCKRWSHQSALVNGTLYIYGGRASTDAQQQDNTWNNDFLTLDLTKTWQISSPSLTGLPQPSGPPAVANGYMWNSHSSLFLYGGEFSDTPVTSPVPFALWEYDLIGKQWNEHSNPQTSSGNNSEGDGQSVQRAAEGAGFGVATVGRGWYFGGHLDGYTTDGWSQSVDRVYLKSLLEFTFPGAINSAIDSLSNGQGAGSDGAWRNITEGGTQDTAGFPERADGILVYVPGFGSQGILLGLTGGTNATFTQMNVIDVYDIASSTWYKQSTSGTTPQARVNPCAVVAAAADGSSYNVYLYGGQNLVPYKDQIQYDDMWILTIPSFTWIQVNSTSQVPPARAGHTCNIWDGQMVVVGGYVGQDLSCDSPGIYVFNLTSLEWTNQFTAISGDQSSNDNSKTSNPFSQQLGQRSQQNASIQGLEGSYGYEVPALVISAIGGEPTGGATVTAPVQSPSGGPMATGKPITYTVTGPSSVVTETAAASGESSAAAHTKTAIAIAVGVVAGIFAVVAAYFAFCAWVYRKQLELYKHHVAATQRAAADPTRAEKEGFVMPVSGNRESYDSTAAAAQHAGSIAQASHSGSSGPYVSGAGAAGAAHHEGDRRSSTHSSTEDLLRGQEPSFWGTRGVLLNPRRSLRVINRD